MGTLTLNTDSSRGQIYLQDNNKDWAQYNTVFPTFYDFNEGSSITLRADPATGYYFDRWIIGEVTEETSNPYTTEFNGDVSVVAVFLKEGSSGTRLDFIADYNQCDHVDVVNLTTSEVYQLTSFPAYVEFEPFDSIQITAQAKSTYELDYFSVDGSTTSDNPCTIVPEVTITIEVVFKSTSSPPPPPPPPPEPTHITVNADPNKCAAIYIQNNNTDWAQTFTTFPAAMQFTAGNELLIRADPKPGFQFSHWSPDITDNPYIHVWDDTGELTANFTGSSTDQPHLTINASRGQCSSIDYVNNTTSETQSLTTFPAVIPFNVGDNITVTAHIKQFYVFQAWSINLSSTSPDNPLTRTYTDNTTLLLGCISNVPTHAFTLNTDDKCDYILLLTSSLGTTRKVTSFPSVTLFHEGEVIMMQAVAKPGYTFAYWINGAEHIKTNPTMVTGGTEDFARTANFVIDPYYVTPAAKVTLGAHTFVPAPAASERCQVKVAELEIADGPNIIHVMGTVNPEVTFTGEEVSENQRTDLQAAYDSETELDLFVEHFEENQKCRVDNLEVGEIQGVLPGQYYRTTITVVLSSIPSITPVTVSGVNTASFGDIKFPINPQNQTLTYTRNLIRKNILGSGQKIDSKGTGLPKLQLKGVLTGVNGQQIMQNLKAILYQTQPQLLITPSNPEGCIALFKEASFSIDKLRFYERQIAFTADFILVPAANVKHPTYSIQLETQVAGAYQTIATDVLDVEVDRQYGGQATAVRLTLDNSKGQYRFPSSIDYMRNIKVVLGLAENPDTLDWKSKFWGIIDDINYTVDKAQGSVVQIQARDWLAFMMEGWLLDDFSYLACYFEDIVLGTGTATGHGLLDRTPIGRNRISAPNYDKYWLAIPNPDHLVPSPNRWPTDQTADNTQRAELLRKLCELYRMNFYMDAGGLETANNPTDVPNLVLAEQPRISSLIADANAGDSVISIDYPLLYSQWFGEDIVISDRTGAETVQFVSINNNVVTLASPLTRSYKVVLAAFVANINPDTNPLLRPPIVKTWGQDIISISPGRVTGVPLRNRIEVYGDGVFSIADSAQQYLLPSGRINPGYIPGTSGTGSGFVYTDATGNFIHNPGFEDGVWLNLLGSSEINEWETTSELIVYIDMYHTASIPYGSYMGILTAISNTPVGSSNLVPISALDSTFTVGAKVRVIPYYYQDTWWLIVGEFKMVLNYYNSATNATSSTLIASYTNDDGWHQAQQTFTKASLPAGTAYVSVGFLWYGTGHLPGQPLAKVNSIGRGLVDGVQLVNGNTLPAFTEPPAGDNTGDSGLQTGTAGLQNIYGKRREIIEDNSLKSIIGGGGINCDVYAYTELIKKMYPEREVHVNCEGDPTVFPGAVCHFTDNNYTGLASGVQSGYLVTGSIERQSVDNGYTCELVLSRIVATITPALFSNILKKQAQQQAGSTLNNSKIAQNMLGTVVE
jgi:hypothetical protein